MKRRSFCGKIMVKYATRGKSMYTERANAKINAYLNITSCREDGYHNIVSVMQTVSLCDIVTVDFQPAPQSSILLSVSGNADLPTDSRNLAWRAAEHFLRCTNLSGAVQITIQKHIPVSAGLGGGSADAAAVLRALNHLCGEPLSIEKLAQIGLTLGADVPFCIYGGAMLATGVGDALERISDMPLCSLVVAIGEERISTPKAYAALDEKYDFFKNLQRDNADVQELIELWQNDDLSASCSCFYNIFEDVISKEKSEVEIIKRVMRKNDAVHALVSGSGPAVFGVFIKQSKAEKACAALQDMGLKAFICHPCGQYID